MTSITQVQWLRRLGAAISPIPVRVVVLLPAYSFVLLASRWLAYQLRFDFYVSPAEWGRFEDGWWWILALQLGFLGCSDSTPACSAISACPICAGWWEQQPVRRRCC